MRTFTATITGISPMSQSKYISAKKESSETYDDFEDRIWKEKMHVSNDGFVVVPAMAMAQLLHAAAKLAGEKIQGRGNKTWGALFVGGVTILHDIKTNVAAKTVKSEVFLCDSQGKKGDASSNRVPRRFPRFEPGWTAEIEILVTNDDIQAVKIEEFLELGGLNIGVGRFRPAKGGNNGRFVVNSFAESKTPKAA